MVARLAVSVTITDQTHFAPSDDVVPVLVGLINSATSQIRIAIYSIDHTDVIDALLAAVARGVAVSILADHSQSEGTYERPQLQRLVDGGCSLVIGESSDGQILHSKYVVIDSSLVGFGSFNFTFSAQKEDNTFSVRSDAALVGAFTANWQGMSDYLTGPGLHVDWQITKGNG